MLEENISSKCKIKRYCFNYQYICVHCMYCSENQI